MKDKWGNASQVDDIREHPIHRCAVPLPQWGRLRNEETTFLDTTPSPIGKAKRRRLRRKKGSQPRLAALISPFQGKGLAWSFPPSRGRGENAASRTSHEEGLRYENVVFPILSFRAKARNLFRLRSGKGCEDSGEREAPCFPRIGRTVFHADSITKENGNGKRKRSLGCARDDETRKRLFPFLFNLLRKPTPPRCARQPLPEEGARVDIPSFLWKEVPRRGGGWMGIPLSPTQSLPRGRRGAVSISHSQISIYP